MADTTYALQQVVTRGSGGFAASLGRPIAGKTGTSTDNKSAWFIGFTPQIVGAVAVYQVGADGSVEAITPFGGFRQITGGSVPVRIWTAMMGEVFVDLAVEAFPGRSYVGDAVIPSPEPSPSVTPSPSASPSPSSSVSVPPLPTPTPVVERGHSRRHPRRPLSLILPDRASHGTAFPNVVPSLYPCAVGSRPCAGSPQLAQPSCHGNPVAVQSRGGGFFHAQVRNDGHPRPRG